MTPILSTVIKSDNGTTEAARIRADLNDLIESLRALLPYRYALIDVMALKTDSRVEIYEHREAGKDMVCPILPAEKHSYGPMHPWCSRPGNGAFVRVLNLFSRRPSLGALTRHPRSSDRPEEAFTRLGGEPSEFERFLHGAKCGFVVEPVIDKALCEACEFGERELVVVAPAETAPGA